MMSHDEVSTDTPSSAETQPKDDDDVSLLRLGGWALFSLIDYRKRAVRGQTRTKHTTKSRILQL